MIYQLMLRNLRIYFRDKASVFFSLLGVFVIIGLYVIFLGKTMVDSMDFPGARYLMDSWIMSGVVAAASITTTMGAFGIMVEDTAKKTIKDFQVSPIKRWQLILGYVLSAVIIGVLMSLITLIFGEIYIVAEGGQLLSVIAFVKTIGLILLSVTASSALIFFLMSFIKSQNAFGTASTLLGTLIGFFMGVYVPIGNLENVSWFIKCFPLSHSGVLLRQVMMEDAMAETFVGIPETEAWFKEFMGVEFKFGTSFVMPFWMHLLVLAATAILFYALTIWVISRRKAKE